MRLRVKRKRPTTLIPKIRTKNVVWTPFRPEGGDHPIGTPRFGRRKCQWPTTDEWVSEGERGRGLKFGQEDDWNKLWKMGHIIDIASSVFTILDSHSQLHTPQELKLFFWQPLFCSPRRVLFEERKVRQSWSSKGNETEHFASWWAPRNAFSAKF